MIRLLGPEPVTPLRSKPFSAATFFAKGDAKTLSPALALLYGADDADTGAAFGASASFLGAAGAAAAADFAGAAPP